MPALLSLAVVLVAGILGGELAFRARLGRVTGWIATGIVLRGLALPGLSPADLSVFAPLTDFVLGYIAFTVASALRRGRLRNAEPRLLLLVLADMALTPALVALALVYLAGLDPRAALLLSAIAVAGAPGTTVVVAQELRARGVFTKTLLSAVPLVDMAAVAVFAFVVAYLHAAGDAAPHLSALAAAAREIGLALAAGATAAAVALAALRTVVGPAFLGPTMVAAILGAWGLAEVLGASGILACTFCGIAVSNMRHHTARAATLYLQPLGSVLFAAFFTLAGTRLDFRLVLPMLPATLTFFAARLAGKSLAAFGAMTASRMPSPLRRYLGPALLPHGGVAVGLILLSQEDPRLAPVQAAVATVGLAALAINQLLGPTVTRLAITRAGEADKDRPRLLDFLREEHIVVPLPQAPVEDVLRLLADRLYETSNLPMAKEAFVDQLLAREREASTCLGEGLMVPHVTFEGRGAIRGILGLSPEGLDFGAHDGKPVHAVFLLATPRSDRDRHLEILGVLAATLGREPTLREQLYRARTAAHAYRILHAEDAAFNHYLDGAPAESS